MTIFIDMLIKVRSVIMRVLRPVRKLPESIEPISTHYGFDRGTPIDRHWIDEFISSQRTHIQGTVLEIGDNRYTKKFGVSVRMSHVLDVDKKNKRATVVGDMRNLRTVIKSNTYDCIICTHVLGLIDDLDAALSECHRILKPGGSLLLTSATISPFYDVQKNYWRLTPSAVEYLFKKHFKKSKPIVHSYGNLLAAQWFLRGYSIEDIDKAVLTINDPRFCCVVGAQVEKKI